jgi:uncharacterized protein YecE (DUF72 family)
MPSDSPTVEINYTFYRMPTEKLVQGWASGTPEPYRLTLKAPRRITHDRRLRDCGELVKAFCHAASALGPKLGILLFQLGPAFKADLPLFDAFLASCRGTRKRPSSSVIPHGWTMPSTSGCARGTSRCASPTATRDPPRSCRRPTTATSGCATKATPTPI